MNSICYSDHAVSNHNISFLYNWTKRFIPLCMLLLIYGATFVYLANNNIIIIVHILATWYIQIYTVKFLNQFVTACYNELTCSVIMLVTISLLWLNQTIKGVSPLIPSRLLWWDQVLCISCKPDNNIIVLCFIYMI